MKQFNIITILIACFLVAPALSCASNASMPDAAWEKYITSQKKLQNAIHYHLKLYSKKYRKSLERSQSLQLAIADQKTARFYWLLQNDPSSIVRDQGFAAFVNFIWTEGDEKKLLGEDKKYQKLVRRIEDLREKHAKDELMPEIERNLEDFKKSVKYKEVIARFRFVSEEVEEILNMESGAFDIQLT